MSSCALAGVSTFSAGMRLVVTTSSALSQADTISTAPMIAAQTELRAILNPGCMVSEYVVDGWLFILPIQVDAKHPLPQRRKCRLLEHREVSTANAAEEARFGVKSGIVSPRVQIATGKHDGRAVEAANAAH